MEKFKIGMLNKAFDDLGFEREFSDILDSAYHKIKHKCEWPRCLTISEAEEKANKYFKHYNNKKGLLEVRVHNPIPPTHFPIFNENEDTGEIQRNMREVTLHFWFMHNWNIIKPYGKVVGYAFPENIPSDIKKSSEYIKMHNIDACNYDRGLIEAYYRLGFRKNDFINKVIKSIKDVVDYVSDCIDKRTRYRK